MAFGDSDGFLDMNMRKVTFIDGTATTPLEFELTYIDGNFSVSELHQYLNERIDVGGAGKYHGPVHGDPIYPSITLAGKLDKFSSGEVSSGTVIDFWQARTGTLYAAAENAPPAGALGGRESFRHVVVEYEKADSEVAYMAFESCTLSPYEISDDEKGTISIPLMCMGRVFADGVMIAGRIGSSETAPSWLPA